MTVTTGRPDSTLPGLATVEWLQARLLTSAGLEEGWTFDGSYADEPDPTPNPTDCPEFDSVFGLGAFVSVAADFSSESGRLTHTVRDVGDKEIATNVLDSVAAIPTSCPVIQDARGQWSVSAVAVPDGQALVMRSDGVVLWIAVSHRDSIVSTVELSSDISEDEFVAVVAAVSAELHG